MQETTLTTAAGAAAGGQSPPPAKSPATAQADEETVAADAQTTNAACERRRQRGTVSLHVKGVPKPLWRRARENAIASELPLKHYILKVLEQCQPFPPSRLPEARA